MQAAERRFIAAVNEGNVAEVESLIAAGVDPDVQDESGDTALMLAAIHGHSEVVRALLAAGADPKAQTEEGFTALMEAAGEGHTTVVRVLLAAGADPNAQTNELRFTALMHAAQEGHAETVRALLAGGADHSIANVDANTALMLAAEGRHYPVVMAFLERGLASQDFIDRFIRDLNAAAVQQGEVALPWFERPSKLIARSAHRHPPAP